MGRKIENPTPFHGGRVSTLELFYLHIPLRKPRLAVPCPITLFESTDLNLTPYAGYCNRTLWEKRYSVG